MEGNVRPVNDKGFPLERAKGDLAYLGKVWAKEAVVVQMK